MISFPSHRFNRLLKTTTVFFTLFLQIISAQAVPEYPIKRIELKGDLSRRSAEISGLAWFEDNLIILPQYPGFAGGGSFLYFIRKEEIEGYLSGSSVAIEAKKIRFNAGNLATTIDGYEGYEAILFVGNRVFLSIEANTEEGMRSYIVSGSIKEDLSAIDLNLDKMLELIPPVNIRNQSYEALVQVGDEIVAIFEANGRHLMQNAEAYGFDLQLKPIREILMSPIDYRITDATEVDDYGRFWVINYFYPGDKDLDTEADVLGIKYGLGKTHAANKQVERLLQLEYFDGSVSWTVKAPILLELSGDVARNWEGLVKLDNRGFIIATDKYPETILAFIDAPLE